MFCTLQWTAAKYLERLLLFLLVLAAYATLRVGAYGTLRPPSMQNPRAYATSGPGAAPTHIDEDEVIAIDLNERYPYQATSSLFSARGETYLELLDRLQNAVTEPNSPAIFLHIDAPSFSMAQIMELRTLVSEAQESGKLVVAYLDGDGSGSSYMLASAADRIYLHPAGSLDLIGLSAELRFYRETLDLFGVEPQFARRSEYKSGPETYTENAASPASRAPAASDPRFMASLSRSARHSIASHRSPFCPVSL